MEQKSWYTSTTLQGAAIATVGFIASMFKMWFKVDLLSNDETNTLVTSIFGIVGLITIIIGRIKATKVLGK